MARAASSLPVPLSPVRITVLSLGAARRILAKTFFRAGESPTMNSMPLPAVSRLGRRRGRGALLLVIEGPLHYRLQVVEAKGLHQVIQGSVLDGLHRPLDSGEAGHHDNLGLRMVPADALQDLHTVQVGHLDVQEDNGVRATGQNLQGRGPARRGGRLEAHRGQCLGDTGANGLFVVHHQHLPAGGVTLPHPHPSCRK